LQGVRLCIGLVEEIGASDLGMTKLKAHNAKLCSEEMEAAINIFSLDYS